MPSNRIPSLASTNRPIASKLKFSASFTLIFNLQHAYSFKLIMYWKRVQFHQ